MAKYRIMYHQTLKDGKPYREWWYIQKKNWIGWWFTLDEWRHTGYEDFAKYDVTFETLEAAKKALAKIQAPPPVYQYINEEVRNG